MNGSNGGFEAAEMLLYYGVLTDVVKTEGS
jgi:hypothetical protein